MIKVRTPQEILSTEHYNYKAEGSKIFRNGIELEKGAALSARKIEERIELFEKYAWYWSVYPDKFIELMTPVDSKFKLKFFQKMFLRSCLRHGRIGTIAPRAAGKSFICLMALFLICIFRPHSKAFSCAPGKAQGAKIAQQKIKQILDLLPALKWEIEKENYGADYTTIIFKNGSQFTILSPLNSTRGQRATFGIIDEYRFCYRFLFKNSPFIRKR